MVWGGIAGYEKDTADDLMRDGLIQRFAFTYEISHKTLKRYLDSVTPTPKACDSMPFQDIIRVAGDQGRLLGDWPKWKAYRDMRGKTSHTYDQSIALAVVADIAAFLTEVAFLRDQLRQRLA
jgi:nucleotidyltransferase substrate binding protein (TIGR01987 family)